MAGIAVQIPLKARSSTRVPNKNFRELHGKPFYAWMLDELQSACPQDWDLYVDSESESVMEPIRARYGERFHFHKRDDWYARDQANGNHLIQQFAAAHPGYGILAQVFVTAVTLPGRVVREAVEALAASQDQYDSCLLVKEETGWVWMNGTALNYDPSRPDGLPRSQDAVYLKETTGLYAITREAALLTGCRVGRKPLFFKVPQQYALDVDTMEDLHAAEQALVARKTGA